VNARVKEDRGNNLGSGIRDASYCFGTRSANSRRNCSIDYHQ
jgi:hypothetical protein